jgi:hypothetical protein
MAAKKEIVGEPAERVVLIDWEAGAGTGAGTDVPVSPVTADAVKVVAKAFAALHGEMVYEASCLAAGHKPNVSGMGAGYAQHVDRSDPEAWKRFMGAAITAIRHLHGSGEKDMARVGSTDSHQYFNALHDFADDLRKG